MRILGIETSCDESAAAIVAVSDSDKPGFKAARLKIAKFKVLANSIASQIKIHSKFGGVVPEVAARNHVKNLLPVIIAAFEEAGLDPVHRLEHRPDLIAVTSGPGLATSLLVGIWTAQALSLAWQKPLVGVNHIEGHILANWLGFQPLLPALCLIVSGGHTELVLIPRLGKYRKIGQTRDDAVGEAYDKVAKLLDLGYPGGPVIDRLAKSGRPDRFALPRPMINSKDFDFSFSGLKTAVRYLVEAQPKVKKIPADLCASFQAAVTDVLLAKTLAATKKYRPKTLLLGGGVAANSELRAGLEALAKTHGFSSLLVPKTFTTDNAAMIAAAGWVNRRKANISEEIQPDPNWEL